MHTGFWWGNLRERSHLEDPGVDGRIISRWNFRKWVGLAWTGFIWLRIGTSILNIVPFVFKTQLVSMFRQVLPLFTETYRGDELAVNEYLKRVVLSVRE